MTPLSPNEGIFVQSQPMSHTYICTEPTLKSLPFPKLHFTRPPARHSPPPPSHLASRSGQATALPPSCGCSDENEDGSGEEGGKSINGGSRYFLPTRPYVTGVRFLEPGGWEVGWGAHGDGGGGWLLLGHRPVSAAGRRPMAAAGTKSAALMQRALPY